ncbi:cryptochrome-1-like [Arctopsyche grandis]|uniref:cryptochrome-1-like n=1 Tax=Arctopsyche grandis TaxID=121162 RepID=UPI00406D9EAC
MDTIEEKHTVHWFRKGLRLHDNPSLREGLKFATTFRCVFIIDPWFAGSSNVGINKWRFLLQCLEDLDTSLRKLNSRLFVIRGQPADALPKLFKEWGTTSLTFEEDPEPFGRVRDKNILAMCNEIGITVVSKVSHTLYKLDNIIEKNGGRAPLTYHQFQTVIADMEPPSNSEATITQRTIGRARTPLNDDHDEIYGVPTLEELGFETDGLRFPVWYGGESEALARLERHLERKAWVASFGRPKMTPQSLLASQTGLSPYLRFGCLSTRLFYHQLTDLYKQIKRTHPPLSLHGQLLWREFFYCAATKNPNFDKMLGNPICVQIPWDKNNEALAKWANAQTGYPWIDAIMIQLREEGWIHHLARHAVACFLTRGDLWISWEEGMKVFEELLLDADWSVNAGTWMWLSCSSFFQQFFHCYCPVRFGRKADPCGDYIRKYIPLLQNIPTQYIHAPWLAPREVQESARCIIGQDYPLPMIDHTTAAKVNIQRIKQVYRRLTKYKTNGTVFKENQENAEQNDSSLNIKYEEDYGNCSKMASDIFKHNQERNTSGLQMSNMPFNKIVVIAPNYDSNVKEQEISNDNRNYSEYNKLDEMNYKYQQQNTNYYTNRRDSYNSNIIENGNNYRFQQNNESTDIDSQTDQKMDREFTSHTADNKKTSESMNYSVPISSHCSQMYDMSRKSYNFTSTDPTKIPFNSESKYKNNYAVNRTETSHEKRATNDANVFSLTSQRINSNYNHYSLKGRDSVNFRNRGANMFIKNESHYRNIEQSLNQMNDRFQANVQDNITTLHYDISENDAKNSDCSLDEELSRFQQGRTVVMQGCSRPEI